MSGTPNVVVFFTDQQRWDSMGVHGNPLDLTPNLDRAAAAGTHCWHAFTCQPVCGPARASLQTGRYASRIGCHTNKLPLPPGLPTLATWFSGAGYATGYIGKWHLAPQRLAVPREWRGGYDYWLAAGALEASSDVYRTVVYDNEDREVFLPGYRVDALTDAAIRFISDRRSRPFFLFLSLLEPHQQNDRDDYPPPRGYRERYHGRWTPGDLDVPTGTAHRHLGGYWGMVRRIDEAYGRLCDALHSLNLENNTVVLFTSDHGCHFRTRPGEYKRSCHESSIRIPMVWSGPGFEGRGRIRLPVSLIDVPPTLCAAAGIPAPAGMQGRPLQSLLAGPCPDWPQEAYIEITRDHPGRAIRTPRWKYAATALDTPASSPSAACYTETELYDLENDPHEQVNRIASPAHRAVAAVLRQRLLARMQDAGEMPLPQIVPATAPAAADGRELDASEGWL